MGEPISETKANTLAEIAQVFGVPAHLLRSDAAERYRSWQEQLRAFEQAQCEQMLAYLAGLESRL